MIEQECTLTQLMKDTDWDKHMMSQLFDRYRQDGKG